jgi:hypothetical protein
MEPMLSHEVVTVHMYFFAGWPSPLFTQGKTRSGRKRSDQLEDRAKNKSRPSDLIRERSMVGRH